MRRIVTIRSLSALALAVLLAGPAAAQGEIWTAVSGGNYEFFGLRVASIGDITGDGVDDVIIGATSHGCNGQDSGLVRVVDGTDGSTLNEFCGDAPLDEYGQSVAGLGDITGDGVPDFAAGTPLADPGGITGAGVARIYNGATYGVIREHVGTFTTDAVGTWISTIGDVTSDGLADYAVGAQNHWDTINAGEGRVDVYNGATGALLYSVSGDDLKDRFGYNIAGGYDLSGNGSPDFVVHSYGDDNNGTNSGSVRAFEGSTGAVLWTVDGDAARDHFGAALAMGDLDGNGLGEVIAGAPEHDTNGSNSGQIKVLDNTGAVVSTFLGDMAFDQLGFSVAVLGDIDGDTVLDFAGGAPFGNISGGDDNGFIRIFNGATGAVLQNAEGIGNGDRIGDAVAGTNDLNADFIPDYVGGGRQYPKGNGQGYVRAFDPATAPPPPPATWPVLPTSFVAVGAGYNDDLESYAGVPPTHFGINELDSFFRQPDPDAWCNIGQKAPVTSANSGSYALEMGGTPFGMSVQHDVSNALIIGLDGTGAGNLELDFSAYDWGEEGSTDDGVFISDDGTTWHQVFGNWAALPFPQGQWGQVTDVDLNSTAASTNGQFYLAFAQSDNTEFGVADGISVDDISVAPAGPTGPTLSLIPDPPQSGAQVTAQVTGNNSGDVVYFAYSLQGGGPTSLVVPGCGTQSIDLTNPVIAGFAAADPAGTASISSPLPGFTSGLNLWVQAFNLTQCVKTNQVATTIL